MRPKPGWKARVVAERREAERAVAAEIARRARDRARGGGLVLGLAAGRSPIGVYRELARLAREERLEPSSLTTFDLDEYEGLAPSDPRLFRNVLRAAVCQPLGLDTRRVHFLGDTPGPSSPAETCAAYEARIRDAGGIDLQLLGLGRNGHLAFNEPGSARDSRTRRVRLAQSTREDAAADFGGLAQVPTHALTMGLATIAEARALRVLAFGAAKSAALRGILGDPPDRSLPAALLREHPDVEIWMDAAACGEADPRAR